MIFFYKTNRFNASLKNENKETQQLIESKITKVAVKDKLQEDRSIKWYNRKGKIFVMRIMGSGHNMRIVIQEIEFSYENQPRKIYLLRDIFGNHSYGAWRTEMLPRIEDGSFLDFFPISKDELLEAKVRYQKFIRPNTVNSTHVSKGQKLEIFENQHFVVANSWFLGIGINNYKYFDQLHNPVQDVKDLRSILTTSYDFNEERVICLFDEDATRDKILNRLESLSDKLSTDDKLLIYFSGHGHISEKKKNYYWVPFEAENNKYNKYQLVSNWSIFNCIQEIEAAHVFLLVDSCFSGSFFQTGQYKSQMAMMEYETKKSRWGLSSGGFNQLVYDGAPGKNSPFAKSIMEVLEKNDSSSLNAAKLIDKVAKLTREKCNQLPEGYPLKMDDHQGGQFVFVRKTNEDQLWKDLGNQNNLKALNQYLDFYPDGIHSEKAFKKIKKIEEDKKWGEAVERDMTHSYREYLRLFPDGAYCQVAKQRINELLESDESEEKNK